MSTCRPCSKWRLIATNLDDGGLSGLGVLYGRVVLPILAVVEGYSTRVFSAIASY